VSAELTRRVAVAVVGIPVTVACLLAGGWLLGALVAVAAAVGSHEFYGFARARGERPYVAVGMVASAGLVLLAVDRSLAAVAPPALLALVGLALALLAASVWLRWPDGRPMNAVATTVAGVLYVGGALAFVPLLRALPVAGAPRGGAWLASAYVLLPLVVTWVGDSAAYFAGRALGRHKLAPHASPGKTIEGAVAGLLGSAASGSLVAVWALDGVAAVPAPALTGAWLGAALGALGQVGDLAESVLKRDAGVKDSGRLLPGHGGVLDRVDALLFAFPGTWALLALVGLAP
jgi:phosphatidate cytidylyltransferase